MPAYRVWLHFQWQDHERWARKHVKSSKGRTKTEASTTLRPCVFFTVRSGFTTPSGASLFDILAVETGCLIDIVHFRAYASISASVVRLAVSPKGALMYPCHELADMNRLTALTASTTVPISKSVSKRLGFILGWSKIDEVESSIDPPWIRYKDQIVGWSV